MTESRSIRSTRVDADGAPMDAGFGARRFWGRPPLSNVGWSRWAPRVVKVRRPPPRLTERAMDGWDDPYELQDDEMELNDDSQGG